jgi:alpha-amylase/alpha-mannosidase (GH57 family)
MQAICVHGHFYQPPRENPWLEAIEYQESAYPYHDWNERVDAECYAPNSAARILDEHDRITQIVNNYSRISFNFGPTLLSWIEEKAPKVYEAIRQADRDSAAHLSGHGNAVAQAYNHMIMPLGNRRDKATQIRWGIRDFQHRFGRDPEAMWLPETAVDLETLDLLAENGIKFTILAPRQAQRVRKIGGRAWKDVSGDKIDPTRAYQVRLPSRRKMALFFYDGPISRAVAFEGLLNNGEGFANRLLSGLSTERDWPQLMHIATDGESYGHHHHHGEMALSFALQHIESKQLARVTNYAEFLATNPPTHEVEIFENSSWSCVHGVERWKSNCGCNSGGHGDWNQLWRAPLRAALDWLRDEVSPRYESRAGQFVKDPWQARDAYIDVILNRSDESVEHFFRQQASRELGPADRTTVLKLLELQRHAMLMYTSCGWFFDELSGIETVQVIQYAGRVVQIARQVFDTDLESGFLEKLALAKSNIAQHRDGAEIYRKFVQPAVVDLPKLAAHYAISSMFQSYPEKADIYCYSVDREAYVNREAGKMRLSVGRARCTSRITRDSSLLSFGVVYLGGHSVTGGVHPFTTPEVYTEMEKELTEAFERADTPEVIRLLDKDFGRDTYSLKSLFRDEQQRILNTILEVTVSEVEAANRRLFEQNAPLIKFLADMGVARPRIFTLMSEFALNAQIRRAFEAEPLEREKVESLLHEAESMHVPLDRETLEFTARRKAEKAAEELRRSPEDANAISHLQNIVSAAKLLPFPVSLWQVENIVAASADGMLSANRSRSEQGDAAAREWVEKFTALADQLRLKFA